METGPPDTKSIASLPEEIACNCGYLLARLGFRAHRFFAGSIAALGLRPAHHGILATLASAGPSSQTALAGALGMDPGQLVGLLDELERAGLITREADRKDRRRHVVTLTEAGGETLSKTRRIAREVEGDLLRGLTDDEQEQLRSFLRRLADEGRAQGDEEGPPEGGPSVRTGV